ncbi:lysophospholipid acyltransferase family protein [Halobacillus kuroshimensis]|uniref:Lysophospholipid acyltransferase family protein n=1 Tax=Halobacillus kuroshimensis TaxID=302481 RepID=A0ABS3DSN2_9BACI|nr:lysophospholipid acyltransferase family protein [Halobacillus kuroshimensis]MBN8234233.1 lysophospholipid acyltransferase family protein [Halobacillus kuroshimensis]
MFKPSHKRPVIEWGFTRFNRMFLNIHFNRILLNAPESVPKENTMFLINHSAWWDPLFIFYLNDQVIHSDGYGMMHEDGLQKFPFFRSIGAFSINSSNRKHLMESLSYSANLLSKGKTVWIFPQGEEQPLEKRPLEFFSGISYIVQKAPHVHVVPVSIYYALEHQRKPNAYITIGEPLPQEGYAKLNRKSMTHYFETAATKQLDELRARVIQEDHEVFRPI